MLACLRIKELLHQKGVSLSTLCKNKLYSLYPFLNAEN